MSESNIEIKMEEVSNVEEWASHCKAPIREMVLLYWIIYIAILFLISEIIGIFKTINFAYTRDIGGQIQQRKLPSQWWRITQ